MNKKLRHFILITSLLFASGQLTWAQNFTLIDSFDGVYNIIDWRPTSLDSMHYLIDFYSTGKINGESIGEYGIDDDKVCYLRTSVGNDVYSFELDYTGVNFDDEGINIGEVQDFDTVFIDQMPIPVQTNHAGTNVLLFSTDYQGNMKEFAAIPIRGNVASKNIDVWGKRGYLRKEKLLFLSYGNSHEQGLLLDTFSLPSELGSYTSYALAKLDSSMQVAWAQTLVSRVKRVSPNNKLTSSARNTMVFGYSNDDLYLGVHDTILLHPSHAFAASYDVDGTLLAAEPIQRTSAGDLSVLNGIYLNGSNRSILHGTFSDSRLVMNDSVFPADSSMYIRTYAMKLDEKLNLISLLVFGSCEGFSRIGAMIQIDVNRLIVSGVTYCDSTYIGEHLIVNETSDKSVNFLMEMDTNLSVLWVSPVPYYINDFKMTPNKDIYALVSNDLPGESDYIIYRIDALSNVEEPYVLTTDFDVTLKPNPCTIGEELFYQLGEQIDQSDLSRIIIFDAQLNQVALADVDHLKRISTKGLNSGVYFFLFEFKRGQTAVKKVVLQ